MSQMQGHTICVAIKTESFLKQLNYFVVKVYRNCNNKIA